MVRKSVLQGEQPASHSQRCSLIFYGIRQNLTRLCGSACRCDYKKYMNKGTFYLLLYLLWMLVGTMYYCYENELGLAVGFYQAVNIGYSIGYGWPKEPEAQNWWFSSGYVILGASFVGVALGFFADKIVEENQDWFMHMVEKQQHEADVAPDRPFLIRMRAHIRYNWVPIRSILLWMVWVALMILYSMLQIRWPFSQAQYFAISACSTGGHMPIPDESPMWMFGLTGFFAAIGVPLMGVAMASLGSLLMEKRDDLDDMKETVEADVTAKELLEMQKYGLEDGDGEVDRAEYIILCMVRLGTDPRLVQFISEEFSKLDDDQSNSLSIMEITKGRVSCDDLQALGRSDEYRAKRGLKGKDSLKLTFGANGGPPPTTSVSGSGMRRSLSAVSLPSVTEETADEENQEVDASGGNVSTPLSVPASGMRHSISAVSLASAGKEDDADEENQFVSESNPATVNDTAKKTVQEPPSPHEDLMDEEFKDAVEDVFEDNEFQDTDAGKESVFF